MNEEEQSIREDEEMEEDFTLGPCGCTDYHMSDCPTRTTYTYDADDSEPLDYWEEEDEE